MKKRILPALLALCMVMSLLPVMAFAATVDCTCKKEHAEGHKHTAQFDGTAGLCAACKADPACNPCPKKDKGCTLAVHEADTPHTGATQCTNDTGCVLATTATHESTCPKRACGFGGEGGKCTLVYNHDAQSGGVAHNNRVCGNSNSTGTCGATTHDANCDMKCACAVEAVHKDGQGNATTCKNTKGEHTNADGAAVCDSCYTNATCNPCEKKDQGCTLYNGHPGAHTGADCTQDAKCVANTHVAECPRACGNTENVGDEKDGVDGCTKTVHHSDKHSTEACLGADNTDTRCPGDENGIHDAGCVNYKACATCKIGWTKEEAEAKKDWKCEGHTGAHDNKICLGYNNTKEGKCGADEHIAGCADAKCECQTDDAELKHDGCTGKAGCPACAKLANCDCPVCRANPDAGVVEGETVTDPAEPTEPEQPTKAEDFSDMEDWMAADVQVMLDKGWMTGMPEGKFEGRKATTGEEAITVIARMLGADIKGGAEWRPSLKAWIEANPDLVEGIEITNGPMARKDIVLVLWRAAEKPESDFDLGAKFSDVDGLEGDRLTAMKWAAEKEIVRGNGDDTVTPDGNVNRAALAATAARYDALQK